MSLVSSSLGSIGTEDKTRAAAEASVVLMEMLEYVAMGLVGWFLAGVCLALALGRFFRWLREP